MIGIALMGAGRMARVHAKAIGPAGGRLVTVYDVVESAAKALASDANASVARSVEEALQHPDVDAGTGRDLVGHTCRPHTPSG